MSFDELPSDAPSPTSQPGENAAEREASDRDAPPSAPARCRRAPRTGTDAASTESTSINEPTARAPRRARQPAEGGNAEGNRKGEKEKRRKGAETTEETQSVIPTPDTQSPTPNAASTSRRRAAKAASADAAVENASASSGGSDIVNEEPLAAASRRRSRRKGGEAPNPDSPESVNAPETPTPASAEAPTPPKTPARTSRRRSRAETEEQGQEEQTVGTHHVVSAQPLSEQSPSEQPAFEQFVSAQPPANENVSAQAAPVAGLAPEAPEAPTMPEALEKPTGDNPQPSRNNRNSGRTRRQRGSQAEIVPAIIAAPDAAAQSEGERVFADIAAPLVTAETAETNDDEEESAAADTADGNASGDTADTRSRKRRNRRNNKGRREPRSTDAQDALVPTAAVGQAAAITETAAVVAEIPLVAEEEAEPIDLGVGTHLIARNGVPQIHINGTPVAPVLFFGNMEGAKNAQRVLAEARRAAKEGVHLHSTLIELPCPLTEAHYVLDEIDVRLRALLDADPNGYVMPRLVFVPARGWKREYATEISVYNDGTNGDPSLTSERFWQEAERALQMLIEHIQGQTYAERVFAYHLERGEWFQPADSGYDRSTANRDAFRDWLREKYKDSLILLRAAWYDGDVQFHTAEIPPVLGKPNPQRAFYETRRERSIIDFNEFTSETTANRLAQLARVVKKASHNNALVSVCYGYTLEFGHGFSGHLALNRLLASPHVDLVCGPPSYRDRKPTGAASFPSPIDSVRLHGKLWLSEDDTKTYLAPAQQDPDDFNPRLGDRFATEQAHARAMGRALATNTAVGWMDLWGEGWLDDEGLWERIGAFAEQMAQQQREMPAPARHDVVVLIDEKSLLHVQKGETFFRKLTNGVRDILQRAGISYGLYLQSDLLEDSFPTDARMYLFLTPFRLPTEQRMAIQKKLQRDNKTLVWLYAPGACEERPSGGTGMEDVATATVGLILRQQAYNSEVGSRVLDANHLLTERLGGRDIGARERLNPSFYSDDPGATVVAEYHASGLPSIAARSFGTWKSVFIGDPILPLELLRGLCRYAGVPVYVTGGEDVVFVGNGWITVHANRDGQRTLRLPTAQSIYDMQERRVVGENTRDYRYFLRMGATRTFLIGTRERFAALGLPNLESPSRPRPNGERGERTERTLADAPQSESPAESAGRQEPGNSTTLPEARELEAREVGGRSGERQLGEAQPFLPAALFTTPEPGLTPVNLLTDRTETDLPAPQEEPHLLPPPEDEDELPSFEPFPQPRSEPRPSSLSTAPPSLREDLATLKAVLEMEMPEGEDNSAAPVPASLSLPKEGLPGLEAVLGPDLLANRRRRRRGGRGRGRKPNGDEADTDTEENGQD